jgi:hypothetical protein
MGEKLKEHWQVAFITAFAVVVLSLGGQAAWSAIVKTNESATVEYVNVKHKESKEYTRESIKTHADAEDDKIEKLEKYFDDKFEAFSTSQDTRFQDLKDYIKLMN